VVEKAKGRCHGLVDHQRALVSLVHS
jgi:hypothetical protein